MRLAGQFPLAFDSWSQTRVVAKERLNSLLFKHYFFGEFQRFSRNTKRNNINDLRGRSPSRRGEHHATAALGTQIKPTSIRSSLALGADEDMYSVVSARVTRERSISVDASSPATGCAMT